MRLSQLYLILACYQIHHKQHTQHPSLCGNNLKPLKCFSVWQRQAVLTQNLMHMYLCSADTGSHPCKDTCCLCYEVCSQLNALIYNFFIPVHALSAQPVGLINSILRNMNSNFISAIFFGQGCVSSIALYRGFLSTRPCPLLLLSFIGECKHKAVDGLITISCPFVHGDHVNTHR